MKEAKHGKESAPTAGSSRIWNDVLFYLGNSTPSGRMGEECSEVKRDTRTNPSLAHDDACRYVVLGTLSL